MELDSVKTQLAGLREFEDTIKNAAIDARRNADMTVINSKKEAELILSKAKAEAEQIVNTRSQQISDLENQIAKLELSKKSYLGKVRSLINSHLDMIDDIASSEIKRELATKPKEETIEVTDSSEVERGKFESIGTQPSEAPAIKTEESTADEKIVPPSPTADTDRIQTEAESSQTEPPEDEPPPDDAPVDPELAAALERYTKPVEPETPVDDSPPQDSEEPEAPAEHPLPGQFVETTSRAEDIPEGFIAGPPGPALHDDTDKVQTEHPRIQDSDRPKAEFKPEELSEELSDIADKFAEEMDRAENR